MPTITATGIIAGRSGKKGALARALEASMKAAVEQAHADGVTAPHEVRQAALDARDAALASREAAEGPSSGGSTQ